MVFYVGSNVNTLVVHGRTQKHKTYNDSVEYIQCTQKSYIHCGTARIFRILQERDVRTNLLGHFDVDSMFCHCDWSSVCFVALPRTMATPIARLNCCSMIGYALPFLSVVRSGEIVKVSFVQQKWPSSEHKSNIPLVIGGTDGTGLVIHLSKILWVLLAGQTDRVHCRCLQSTSPHLNASLIVKMGQFMHP